MGNNYTFTSWKLITPGLKGCMVAGCLMLAQAGHSLTIIPATGQWFVDPGNNTVLQDAGGNGNYSDGQDGYVNIRNYTNGVFRIVGQYQTESTWDVITLYDGTNINGTQIAEYSGTGTIDFTCAPGQGVAIRFRSDGSVTGQGFNLAVIWSTYPDAIVGSNLGFACGGQLNLWDPGFTDAYGDNVDTWTSFGCSGDDVIRVIGSYDTEGGYDYVKIYAGDGIGGTELASYSGAGSIDFTSPLGQTITVRFYSDGSIVSAGFNVSVKYVGTCGNPTTPAFGSTALPCGSNSLLRDHGGVSNYDDGVSGHTVLECNGNAQVRLEGMYNLESCCDRIRIYEGSGIGGPLLAEYGGSGSGAIDPLTGPLGTPITVELTSDGSVTRSGFEFSVSSIGQCSLVGIDEQQQLPLIGVAPNPTSGPFAILRADVSASIIELHSVAGERVMRAPFSSNVDISALASGVYLMTIFDKEGSGLYRSRIVRE